MRFAFRHFSLVVSLVWTLYSVRAGTIFSRPPPPIQNGGNGGTVYSNPTGKTGNLPLSAHGVTEVNGIPVFPIDPSAPVIDPNSLPALPGTDPNAPTTPATPMDPVQAAQAAEGNTLSNTAASPGFSAGNSGGNSDAGSGVGGGGHSGGGGGSGGGSPDMGSMFPGDTGSGGSYPTGNPNGGGQQGTNTNNGNSGSNYTYIGGGGDGHQGGNSGEAAANPNNFGNGQTGPERATAPKDPNGNNIYFYHTSNYCLPQVIQFGTTKCYATNRGMGNGTPGDCNLPPGKRSQSNGTSIPPTDHVYNLSIKTNSSYFNPRDSKYGQMGPYKPVTLDGSALLIHSWHTLQNPTLQQLMNFQTEGCIAVSQECSQAIDNFVQQHGGAKLHMIQQGQVNYGQI